MSKENLKVVSIKRNSDASSLLKHVMESIEFNGEQPTGAIVLLTYKDSDMDGLEVFSTNLSFHQQIGVLETAKLELFSES